MEIAGEVLDAISRECVRLKAQHYGKGPVETKSYVNDDFIFCVMKGGFTPVERTLIDAGDEALVRAVRLRFQEQMTEAFTDAVESLTGRPVVGYQSVVIFSPDITIEIFLLGEAGDRSSEDGISPA